MNLAFSPLESFALEKLIAGPCTRSELHDYLSEKRHISRAGFYKVLGSLKKQEIFVEAGGVLSVSKIWLAEAKSFFQKLAKQKSAPSYLARQVAALDSKDRIMYEFSSMVEIDVFLLNLMLDVSELLAVPHIFIREPHEFFVVANSRRTNSLLEEFKLAKRSVYLLIESDSEIDSQVIKSYLKEPAQGYRIPRTKRTDPRKIISIIGDVVIELRMAKRFSGDLGNFFKKDRIVSPHFRESLQTLMGRRDAHTISIYRSPPKAAILTKAFKKYFVLK